MRWSVVGNTPDPAQPDLVTLNILRFLSFTFLYLFCLGCSLAVHSSHTSSLTSSPSSSSTSSPRHPSHPTIGGVLVPPPPPPPYPSCHSNSSVASFPGNGSGLGAVRGGSYSDGACTDDSGISVDTNVGPTPPLAATFDLTAPRHLEVCKDLSPFSGSMLPGETARAVNSTELHVIPSARLLPGTIEFHSPQERAVGTGNGIHYTGGLMEAVPAPPEGGLSWGIGLGTTVHTITHGEPHEWRRGSRRISEPPEQEAAAVRDVLQKRGRQQMALRGMQETLQLAGESTSSRQNPHGRAALPVPVLLQDLLPGLHAALTRTSTHWREALQVWGVWACLHPIRWPQAPQKDSPLRLLTGWREGGATKSEPWMFSVSFVACILLTAIFLFQSLLNQKYTSKPSI